MRPTIRKSPLIFLIFLLSALSLTQCSPDRESRHSFKVEEIKGVLTAVNTGGPKYSEPLFEFEEVLRLEQDESREETLVFRAYRYYIGEDGYFYMDDGGNNRIAVFGPDGKYVRSIGREGSGPGEFRSVNIQWIREGRLTVWDRRNLRTSLFRTDGTLLDTFSPPQGTAIQGLYPIGEHMVLIGSEMASTQPGEERIDIPKAIVMNVRGDTLSQVDAPPFSWGRMILLEEYTVGVLGITYFSSRSDIVYHPDKGILTCSSAEPELRWHDLDGKPDYTVRLGMEPEPVTSEERQAIERILNREIESATDNRQKAMAEARKKHAVIPATKSFWSIVTVDDLGYCWLGSHPDNTAPEEDMYQGFYRVLSPEGEYLGDSTWPISAANVSRGHLLTYQEDEETGEVEYIVYRIVPAVEGLVYP